MSSDEESVSDKGRILSDIEDEQNGSIELVEAPRGAEDDGEGTEEVQRDETEGNEDGNGVKQVVQPKRVIKNPQPKLNPETLKGRFTRAFSVLCKILRNIFIQKSAENGHYFLS